VTAVAFPEFVSEHYHEDHFATADASGQIHVWKYEEEWELW
jgi:hypothetical protein